MKTVATQVLLSNSIDNFITQVSKPHSWIHALSLHCLKFHEVSCQMAYNNYNFISVKYTFGSEQPKHTVSLITSFSLIHLKYCDT